METLAQRDAERLNHMALNSVKKKTLGEKAKKEMEEITKAQRDKHQDRFSLIQNFKNQQARELTSEAMEKFKEDCEDISHRKTIRFEKEREHSHRNW